ncbi:hypothetical protein [Cupriavidus necator]
MINKKLSAALSAADNASDRAASGDSRQKHAGQGAGQSSKQRSTPRARFKVPYAPALTLIPFRESCAAEWADACPTHIAGTIPVSEKPEFDDGSIFCFWIGDQDPESVIEEVAGFIACYDVVGVYFVRALPDMVGVSLEKLTRW